MKQNEFDLIIVGGAMVGATLALALNQQKLIKPLNIAVVEAFDVDNAKHPGFDARAIALSLGSTELLKAYKLWDEINPMATAIKSIHVSDRNHFGMTDLGTQHAFNNALGQVIELNDVGQLLTDKLKSEDQITFYCPAKVEKITRTQESVELTLSDGKALLSKLVVAADGVASTCCEQLSIEQTVKTLPQSAIITNISTSLPHQHCAFERFTNQGPLALLPMSDNRYSVVWCVKDEYVNSILDMSDEAFTEHLQKAFGWRAGKITKAGSRSHYPLNIYQRPQSVSHRFVAIGNAAQTLHPIAGQGFNLGLRDVAALVEAIGDHQGDIGDYSVLHHYQVKRSCDKSNTIMLTESLVRLFSNDYFATSLGRNVGLALMDNLPFLKAPLLKHTLGLVEVHK